jgi:hypothetical protein
MIARIISWLLLLTMVVTLIAGSALLYATHKANQRAVCYREYRADCGKHDALERAVVAVFRLKP